jgi:hypothetical protein
MVMNSLKQTAYEDENYRLEVELVGDIAVLHCSVITWKPSVLRNMYFVFAMLQKTLKEKGYVKMSTISPNPKFAKLFGGETVNTLVHNDIEYEVITWDLK